MFQYGKISTGMFGLLGFQPIDMWSMTDCKTVSSAVASAISAKLLVKLCFHEQVLSFQSLVQSCFGAG